MVSSNRPKLNFGAEGRATQTIGCPYGIDLHKTAQLNAFLSLATLVRQHYMDPTDQQRLSLLLNDARTSAATLAIKLDVWRGSIRNRITRLKNAGIVVPLWCGCPKCS
jgi:hypothetical protein